MSRIRRALAGSLLLWGAAARGEFLKLEITLGGIDCASCLDSLPGRLQRVRGVESVALDRDRSEVSVTLAAGNRARLEQIRDVIEQDGTRVARAKVRAIGRLTGESDAWVFRPAGAERGYRATIPDRAIAEAARGAAGGDSVVEGTIDNAAELSIRVTGHARLQ